MNGVNLGLQETDRGAGHVTSGRPALIRLIMDVLPESSPVSSAGNDVRSRLGRASLGPLPGWLKNGRQVLLPPALGAVSRYSASSANRIWIAHHFHAVLLWVPTDLASFGGHLDKEPALSKDNPGPVAGRRLIKRLPALHGGANLAIVVLVDSLSATRTPTPLTYAICTSHSGEREEVWHPESSRQCILLFSWAGDIALLVQSVSNK